jgi:predicted dehydrogenase
MDVPSNTRRRQLLGALGTSPLWLAGAAHAGPSAVGQPLVDTPALPEIPAKRLGWAVVGLGSFALGQVIPGFLDARASRVTALVSGNPDKRKTVGDRYAVAARYDYSEFDRLADDDRVDCVYIALPVGLHAEYTIRALQAGKHVLCEKPMASSSAECEAMIAAARKAQRQLGVAYRVHFEPTNVEALNRFRAGEIGDLRYLSTEAGFSANPDFPPHAWRLTRALGGAARCTTSGSTASTAH